jgi:ubiquinone/menaquinone biosynthesis C-methylase UbiE
MTVVDLCCGDGWFTLQIAKIARHVVAIDIDPHLLEVARHRLTEGGVTNCAFGRRCLRDCQVGLRAD